jgi:HEAT repeat protein
MSRGLPEQSLAYFGSAARLRSHIGAMLAGKEVVITAVTHGTPGFRGYEAVAYKDLLRGNGFPVWRLRASLDMPRNVYHTATDPKCIVGLGAGDEADVPPLVKALDDQDSHNRADAADELGLIGRAAKEAVPALARLAAKDPDPFVAIRAGEALVHIEPRPEFVALLDKRLTHDRATVRRAAAESLGNCGEQAAAAVPNLVATLKDKDTDVRWAAAVALGRVGPKAKAAVPDLVAALKDAGLASMAADALGGIGPDASAAVPELARLIESGDKSSRWPAAIALVRIGGAGSEAATPVFMAALQTKDERARWDALFYMQRLGPRARAAVPAILALLKDPDAFMRELAVWTIGKIGPEAKAVVPDLLPLLGSDDEDLRLRAAVSLAEIGGASLPGLVKQLGSKNAVARYWAAYALERMGPQAAPSGPSLVERLSADMDSDVRGAAASALGAIGPEAKGGAAALAMALRDDTTRVRILAAEALWRVENKPDRALPILAKELQRTKDPSARKEAAEALGRLKTAAKPALPPLRQALEDADTDVRIAAAEAVWLVSAQADAAVPVLAAALKDEDADSRKGAAEALARLGPVAKGALPVLARTLKDDDANVRKAAAEAMRKIDAEAAAKAGIP